MKVAATREVLAVLPPGRMAVLRRLFEVLINVVENAEVNMMTLTNTGMLAGFRSALGDNGGRPTGHLPFLSPPPFPFHPLSPARTAATCIGPTLFPHIMNIGIPNAIAMTWMDNYDALFLEE